MIESSPVAPAANLVWSDPWHNLAFAFGSGLMPGAGTWGSLVALPFVPLAAAAGLGLSPLGLTMLFGVWLCGKVARERCDHEGIVWDESPAPDHFLAGAGRLVLDAAGFVVFRVMDIPNPADQLGSAYPWRVGIMLDDILAGVAAWAVMQGLVAQRWLDCASGRCRQSAIEG
ncbi:phosphatidylglycerophosphatase A [Stutzerimonas xanthomarina]|uniref:phosphatidylglycerophosphatase A family protein n=1 Tax=Stutzerimonas xanthomarina TaxID=271420 RepID=UPI003AA90E31